MLMLNLIFIKVMEDYLSFE